MNFVTRIANKDNQTWVDADPSIFNEGWFNQLHPEARDNLTAGKSITLTGRDTQSMFVRLVK